METFCYHTQDCFRDAVTGFRQPWFTAEPGSTPQSRAMPPLTSCTHTQQLLIQVTCSWTKSTQHTSLQVDLLLMEEVFSPPKFILSPFPAPISSPCTVPSGRSTACLAVP